MMKSQWIVNATPKAAIASTAISRSRSNVFTSLEREGFTVCAQARDGVEAVELARETAPDLAVLDVRMPRLNGIDAAREIIAERPIPVVIVTAYGQDELLARAVDAGVYGYLTK